MATTSNYQLPYPEASDPVNVAEDIELLAKKIDTSLGEVVQDTVGGMVAQNTENGISVTYNDELGKLNFDVTVIPSQTNNGGKYLTTDGTNTSWDDVDALPDQTGNAGKYLTTDGEDATWQSVVAAEGTFYLVRNNTGVTIPKGTLVSATGAEPSGRVDVAPHETTGLQDSELRVMGVATTNISNGVNGTVMSFGTLKDIDTRGSSVSAIAVGDETWAEGDILYAHPTVDGKLTKVRPQHDLAIAFITVRHATAGQIVVRIIPGNFHLEWLHDVEVSEPENGQVLAYDSATSLWKNIGAPESSSVTVSATAPESPSVGNVWFNSSEGNSYIYYDGFWVPLSPALAGPEGPQGEPGATGATGPAGVSGNDGALSPNAIINGAFDINQRSFTSGTTDSSFVFDRWFTSVAGDGTATFSAQAFTPGAAPVAGYEGTNFLRVVTTAQGSASVRSSFTQRIESVRTFAGETVTLSFFARSASGTPKLAFDLLQGFGTGGSTAVILTAQQATISSSWTRYSATFSVPSISGKTIGANNNLSVNIFVSAGSNFDARTGSLGIQSNTFDIWGVQLEAGSVATPFKRNAPSIQAELAACQRYYYQIGPNLSAFSRIVGGFYETSGFFTAVVPFPVTMRTQPSSIVFSNLTTFDGSVAIAVSNVTSNGISQYAGGVNATVSGATQFRPGFFATANTSGFLGFSAEL